MLSWFILFYWQRLEIATVTNSAAPSDDAITVVVAAAIIEAVVRYLI